MKKGIERKNLDQSIELITELNLEEEDLEKIFINFESIIKNPDVKKIIDSICGTTESTDDVNLIELIKDLSHKISIKDLNLLLERVIKNEDFVDFIQDLLLEKLL